MESEIINFYNNKCFLLVASCIYDSETHSVKLTNYAKQ